MLDSKETTGNLYHKVLVLIHGFLSGIRKNFILLLVCIGAVTGGLFIYNYQSSGVYTTSFTVIYEELVRKIYGDRLAKLDALVQKGDDAKLKELLGVSDEAIRSIEKIQGKNILGDDLDKDLNTDKIPFVVELEFTDAQYVSDIQQGILDFLENGNSYLKEKKALRIQETESEIKFIDAQLAMLDTLKRQMNQENALKSAKKEQSDLGGAYEFSYSLFKKKQALEAKTAMPTNLKIIDDIVVPLPKTKAPSLILAVGTLLGFVVYLILVYLLIPAYKLGNKS
ncbi:MAG: hypothetical protein R2800_12275 [Flavipsychrobacter sp.]